MRNLLGTSLLLSLFTFSTAARADEAVVGVVLSSQQALVWDGARQEYAIRRVGEPFAGGTLTALGADHVVVDRQGTAVTVELSSPPSERLYRKPHRMAPLIIGSAPLGAEAANITATAVAAEPIQPIPVAATPVAPAPVAVTPVAPAPVAVTPIAPAPVAVTPVAPAPVAVAPIAPAPVAVAPIAEAAAPVAAPAVESAPALPANVLAAPVVPAEPLAAVAAPPGALSIPRDDFDRELGDFETLAAQIRLSRAPHGGYRLDAVADGCFLERIGLRAGDVVRRIDGRPVNGPADASAAYAWLHIADHFSVDVERQGQPLRLFYTIAR